MFWGKEVAFNFSIPLFNVLKFFFISLLFGSILDYTAEITDSALARREVLVNGRTKIRNKFIPRLARAGFWPEASRRAAASLLIILLALASEVLSELSYDTKLVSIKTETSPLSYVVVRNGTVLNHPLFGIMRELSLSEGVRCLGSLREGFYIDSSISIYDDGEVNIQEETSGFRKHFRLQCGHSLKPSTQKYPIAVRRNSSSVDAWLWKAGASAISVNDSENALKNRFSGSLRIQYLESITEKLELNISNPHLWTDLFRFEFPKRSLLCVTRLYDTFRFFHALCWSGDDRVDTFDFDLQRDVNYPEVLASDGLHIDRATFDGYSSARGIKSLSSFLSFTTLYYSYHGRWDHIGYTYVLYQTRMAVLNMKYTDEFKGREITTNEVIRPVIRYKFFISSLIIVVVAGITVFALLISKRTIPILTPEYVAGLWYCSKIRNGQNHSNGHPEKVYLMVGESSEGEESCQKVHVGEDVKSVVKPDPDRLVVGLSH